MATDRGHELCRMEAIRRAETLCQQRGVRLTRIRRRVLELIACSHGPVGAYALLDALRVEGFNPQPPTIYRALEFLTRQALIHRLESRNAFIGCPFPDRPHQSVHLICTRCQNVEEREETPLLTASINALSQAAGFKIKGRILELSGICQKCQNNKSI